MEATKQYLEGLPVGLFTRLSTAKRTEELTEQGFERQHERSAALCEAKGWRPVRFYQDLGSAYRKPGMAAAPQRKDFEQALKDIEQGIVKGLVFFKLDRFVRDHGDFERALAVVEARGAFLASVTEPLDTSTPMGEAIARLLVTFARMESQTIALRIAAQAEQQAYLGQPWRGGRHRAYGYEGRQRDEDGNITNADRVGIAIIEDERTLTVEMANRLLGRGRPRASQGEVVRWLNEAGIPAPAGGYWNRAKLRSLLTNPRLAGLRRYHGEVVAKGVWTPILDEETFNELGRLFAQRRRPGRPAVRWLASGIVYCGLCDAHLLVRGHQSGRSRYVCDSSGNDRRAGEENPGCGKVTIMAEPVDTLIAERVIDRLCGPRLVQVRHQLATAEHRALAAQLEDDRADLIEAARQRFVSRELDPPAYAAVKLELDRRIADAERRLDLGTSAETLAGLPRVKAELTKVWDAADIERRREIVRAVVERIEVYPAIRRGRGIEPSRVVIPPDAWKA
jgi:site-specific DNA recombinase